MRKLKIFLTTLVLGGLCSLAFSHNHTYKHHIGCHKCSHNTATIAYIADQTIYNLVCNAYGGDIQSFCQSECTYAYNGTVHYLHRHHGESTTYTGYYNHGHHAYNGTVHGPHRHHGYLITNFDDACNILCNMHISVSCKVPPQQLLNNGGTQGTTTATAAPKQGNLVLWIEY